MTSAYLDFVNLCVYGGYALGGYSPDLVLDCANGVGAVPMQIIAKKLAPNLKI